VLIDRHHDALDRQAELVGDAADDPLVGLMRNDPVDGVGSRPGVAEDLHDHAAQFRDGVTVDLATMHSQVARGPCRRRSAVYIQQIMQAPV